MGEKSKMDFQLVKTFARSRAVGLTKFDQCEWVEKFLLLKPVQSEMDHEP
jgi:hypothetical protein